MPAANRPHFHVWALAESKRGSRMLYQLRRGFHTQQAAAKWAKRHYPERETMTRKCERPECAPKL